MVQTRNVAKRQKVEECTSCMESVMFSCDSLFKNGLPNLALTCRRFGIAQSRSDVGDDSLSLAEETARRVVQDIATEEQMNALPNDGENWLSKYNYLQLLRAPLTFDQFVGSIEYVEGNKFCVAYMEGPWATAFSNNIMTAGKHYVSFEAHHVRNVPTLFLGVMRPGEAMQSTKGDPRLPIFYQYFTQRRGSQQYNNTVSCCMYYSYDGHCCSSAWEGNFNRETWDGMEELRRGSFEIGMLLDLDEGTLSVYNNGRKLGVMKRGLAGHYCWVVSLLLGCQVTIKRGTVPES